MLRVSQPAVSVVKSVLSSNHAPDDAGLRLVPADDGGVSLTIARPKPGDEVVKEGDRPLVIVESSIAHRLDQMMFDIAPDKEAGQGMRFVFRSAEAGA